MPLSLEKRQGNRQMHPSNSWQGQKTTPVENAQQRRAHFQRCKKGNGERSTSVAPGIVRPSGGNVLFRNKTFHEGATFIPGSPTPLAHALLSRRPRTTSFGWNGWDSRRRPILRCSSEEGLRNEKNAVEFREKARQQTNAPIEQLAGAKNYPG